MPISNPSAPPLTQATSGSYTGNDTENRAIPHGLGAVPKLVIIRKNTGATVAIRHGTSGFLTFQEAAVSNNKQVTLSDVTNFYVGDAANYSNSVNATGSTYEWVAFR